MKEQKDKLLFVTTLLLVIIHLAGVVGLHSGYCSLFLTLTPVSLLLSTLLILYQQKEFNASFIVFCSLCFLLGFFIEVIGVRTGIIFGNYHYGNTLGIKFLDVPLIIGINWMILIYCVGCIFHKIPGPIAVKSLMGAGLLTGLDLLMEPIAVKYDFWKWENSFIPAQNYVAWFGVSFLFLLIFHSLKFNKENKLAPSFYIIQLAFFGALLALG